MARVVAPKSPEYDARLALNKRNSRISALAKKSQMTQPEKDEVLKLLMEDYAARNIPS